MDYETHCDFCEPCAMYEQGDPVLPCSVGLALKPVRIPQSLLPSYLNCPFCPAQAYLTRGGDSIFRDRGYRQYVCPANHKFLVKETFDDGSSRSVR
jgi:hypothetical protein